MVRFRGTCCCDGNSIAGRNKEERTAAVARSVVIGKIANCRTVVLRALRGKPEGDGAKELETAARRLGRLLETVAGPAGLDEIRGHEGDAGRVYFGVLRSFSDGVQRGVFLSEGATGAHRSDNMNALLSLCTRS